MEFRVLLRRMNSSRHQRNPGQCTPDVASVWRELDPDNAALVEAVVAWELKTQRLARPDDEKSIRTCLAKMRTATAEMKAAKAGQGQAA